MSRVWLSCLVASICTVMLLDKKSTLVAACHAVGVPSWAQSTCAVPTIRNRIAHASLGYTTVTMQQYRLVQLPCEMELNHCSRQSLRCCKKALNYCTRIRTPRCCPAMHIFNCSYWQWLGRKSSESWWCCIWKDSRGIIMILIQTFQEGP